MLNPPWSFIHELVNKTPLPMTDQQSALKVQGCHRSRGTEREQWWQRVRGMTDKISIWISIRSRENCPLIQYMCMEHLLLAGHWTGPWGTARRRKARPLSPRAEMLRPTVHQDHPESYFINFPGSQPGTPKRTSWAGSRNSYFKISLRDGCNQCIVWHLAWQVIKQ